MKRTLYLLSIVTTILILVACGNQKGSEYPKEIEQLSFTEFAQLLSERENINLQDARVNKFRLVYSKEGKIKEIRFDTFSDDDNYIQILYGPEYKEALVINKTKWDLEMKKELPLLDRLFKTFDSVGWSEFEKRIPEYQADFEYYLFPYRVAFGKLDIDGTVYRVNENGIRELESEDEMTINDGENLLLGKHLNYSKSTVLYIIE
ncbi:LptM family lipoprotein [Desulfuribacillus alkaliarsenatis]|uniref:Uncharacterized protein n=1 Tax=Desulfuribacillus alkaliarsenatis TaxID=766136 RepID=A0A1E5G3R0_9FIRM|nr:hypothetical protein [Desulfuribacillus alkaliarsenatis]OEF97220.1 hypothetical protein BHF68_14765 [Desulfuribacillus alkaliarsenatis]